MATDKNGLSADQDKELNTHISELIDAGASDSDIESFTNDYVKKKVVTQPTTTSSESKNQDGAKVLSDVSEQFRKAGTQGEKPLSESGTATKKLVEDTPTYEDKQSLSATDIANEKKRLEKMPTSESMLLKSGNINTISSDIVRNKNISAIASQDPNVLKLNSLILERDKAIQANEGQKVADLSSEIDVLKNSPIEPKMDLQQQLEQRNLKYSNAPQDRQQEPNVFPQTLNEKLVVNKAKPVKTVGELHELSNEAQKKVSELQPELDKIRIPFDEQVAQLRKENRFKSTEENGVRKLEGFADTPEAFVLGARNTFKDGLGMLKQVFGTKEDRQNYSDQRALEDGVLFPTETKGVWTSGAEMAGGVAPYIATGALGGESIVGQILSNGLTMGATGVGSAYHQEYQKQKALGLNKDDADKIALEKSAFHGATQAALGGGLPFFGAASKSILMHPKDLKLLEQFASESALGKPYVYNAQNMKASLKGFASEMAGVQSMFAGEHILNNSFDRYVLGDKKKNIFEGTADVIMQGSLLHLGMHVLPSVPKAIKDIYDVNFSKRYPSIQQAVDMAMQEGKITKEQADAITVPLRQKYVIYNAMPEGLTAKQMVSIKPETEQILELSKKEPSAVENPDITKDRIAQLQKTIAEKLGTPLTEKEQKSYEKLQEKKADKEDKLTPSEKSELKHYENRIATAENEKANQAEEKKAEKEKEVKVGVGVGGDVEVFSQTDAKGRVIKYFSNTTEKDGVTKTTFTFNRSDKDSSQRNNAINGVPAEIALGGKYTIDEEYIPEGTKVVGVSEIRTTEKGAAATVMFETDGQRFQGSVKLKAVEQSLKETTKAETPKVEAGSGGVGGDVEATAKALEDLSKNKTERFYPDDKVILTTKDGKEVEVSFRGYNGEKKAVIFGSRGSGINQMEVDVYQLRAKNKSDKLTKDERKNLLSKIDFKDKEAPAYKEDFTDKELQDLSVRYPKRDKLSNKEKNDFNDFQIATTPLKKWQEQEYGVDDPLDPTNIKLAKEHETAINNIINNDKFSTLLAEAYHKAKKDGSNPELVKAVEQSLKETTKAETKVAEKGVEEPITEEIKTAIDNGEITREQVDGFIEQDESVITDIERKAESENEAELNEAIDQADKLIGEAVGATESKGKQSDKTAGQGEVTGKDKIARGLDALSDILGGKLKAFSDTEKPKIVNALRDIAEGLIEEGKATIDNVVEKLYEYVKDKMSKEDYDSIKNDVKKSFESKSETNEKVKEETKITGITKAVQEEEWKSLGIDSDFANQLSRDWNGTVLKEANERIKSNPHIASILAKELNDKPRPTTDTENAILLIEKRRLQNLFDEHYNDKSETDNSIALLAIQDKLVENMNAIEGAGTALGRGLNSLKMAMAKDYSLATMLAKKRLANGNKPLSPEVEKQITDLHQKITDLQKKFDDYVEKKKSESEENNAQGGVDRARKDVRRTNRNLSKEKLKAERDVIVSSIKDKVASLLESATEKTGGKLNAMENRVDNKELLASLSTEISNLVKNLVEDKVLDLADIVDNIHDELKGVIPDLSKREVRDAISGYGKEPKKQTKSEMQSEIDRLKKEAKQLSKQEDIASGKIDEPKLKALKTRTENRIKELKDKLDRGDFSKAEKKIYELDDTALRLKAELDREKAKFSKGLQADALAKRDWSEKGQDALAQWSRAIKLSGIVTLGKLTAAAAERVAITPAEEAVGGVIGKLFPKLSQKAEREGGINARIEAQALSRGFMKGMEDSWKILTTGESNLDVSYGKQDNLPHSVLDFFGHLHGALKAVPKRIEFERSFAKRMESQANKGIDVSNPLVQTKTAIQAYKDSKRAIFMQDNMVASAWTNFIKTLERKDKNTGESNKAIATIGKTLLPFVKIPTNIVGETLTYAGGSVSGSVKLAKALTKGIENVSPEEADIVLRHLKKGSLGLGMLALGFMNPQSIGGYYQKGEKRRDDEVGAGEVELFGQKIPKFLVHNPLLECLQIGSTIRRVSDSYTKKKPNGAFTSVMAGLLGIADEVPFIKTGELLKGAMESEHEANYFVGSYLKGMIDPALLQDIARFTDKDEEGKVKKRQTDTVLEHIESGLPFLRQQLEEKETKNRNPTTPEYDKSGNLVKEGRTR